ncbi:hypothetical protein LSAT2_030858 [Lamellibrachia satsuma]|nr:hypothetical protein LSAT2_030858 [Lamellibrachia satsuma]
MINDLCLAWPLCQPWCGVGVVAISVPHSSRVVSPGLSSQRQVHAHTALARSLTPAFTELCHLGNQSYSSHQQEDPSNLHHRAAMGSGEGSGGGGLCPGLLWAILWFIGLIFIAWPVGFFIAWLYIFLLPFGACISPIKDLCDALLKLVQFPFTFAQNMVNMKPCCS